ncbi:hypothetical protein EA187_14455 [Lujinxingia sediminis]|uniref:Glycosyltransferase RgtA/B/C/D-like domain-containing protein n=1 Tax=Lujinxingia sediminis TaxID=2480984 RepID=A0ABY0CRF2_9DELT|nr:glycosyltransferase family 39 protein [Lujinxingia sediminis]RVU42714.1 hypothetical protein EA187_14455 [Lujinxingia sediminis]
MMARIAAALVVALSAVLVFWSAGNLGIWEPWESGALRLAIEVSEPPSSAAGDVSDASEEEPGGAEEVVEKEASEVSGSQGLDARARAVLGEEEGRFSGLRLWWLTQTVDDEPVVESGEVGQAERGVRALMMLMALLLVVGVGLWARRYLGERAALLSAVVLATTPAVLLGAVFVSGPVAMMFSSALALLGVVGAALEEARRRERGELARSRPASVLLGVGTLGLVLSAWEGGVFGALVPVLTALVVALLEWRSPQADRPLVRTLIGWRGALWAGAGLITLVVLAGQTGWAHLLTQHGFADNVDFSSRFGWWLRQIGFGFFPWFALAFAGYGYMSQRLAASAPVEGSATHSDADASTVLMARVLMLWPALAFVVMAVAGRLGHATFAAFVPLALGVAWALSDKDYWAKLRLKPQLYLLIALSAIFVVMMLGKDIERFPPRLIELVTAGQDELGLGEDYEYGRALKLWKYGYVALLAAYFAGAISWLVFFWRDLKVFWGWLKRTWRAWRNKGEGSASDAEAHRAVAAGAEMSDAMSSTSATPMSPGEARAAEREAYRQEDGKLARLAAFAEGYTGLLIVATLGAVSWAVIMMGVFLPDLDSNLSNRKIVASYLEARQDDEPLLRYGYDTSDSDFYLRGLESIAHARAFNARFEDEERFFALIPRDRLAAVHSDVRRAHKADLVVVDNSSASMVLVSNMLGEGEEDQSPLAGALLDELPDSATPLSVKGDPQSSPAFNRQIELIGYELNKKAEGDGRPRYSWGEELTMTLYFKSLRRVTSEQEIFVHIDTPGNRIGADHDPVGGNYPTSRWLPGDIVRDEHTLTIDRYSTPGTYTIWMGFYKGSNRMEVSPDKGHDGENRVKVAEIEIEAF